MRLERDHPEEEPDGALGDDRLRLVFTCCHPALMMDARVALTLRMLGGLTTAEVARAFLVPEPTMAQRLVRAKRKIAAAHIPYRVPATRTCRIASPACSRSSTSSSTRATAASAGERLVREDLCAEAIRLARLLAALMPDDAETLGLLALMLLHDARRAARTEPGRRLRRARPPGPLALGSRADRRGHARCWIARCGCGVPGPYQLQAAIAALHAAAPDADATDWPQIAALYARLAAARPVTGRRGQPRGRGRVRGRPAGGAPRPRAAARRSRAHCLPAAPRRPRRAAAAGRGHGRRRRRIRPRDRAHDERRRAGGATGAARGAVRSPVRRARRRLARRLPRSAGASAPCATVVPHCTVPRLVPALARVRDQLVPFPPHGVRVGARRAAAAPSSSATSRPIAVITTTTNIAPNSAEMIANVAPMTP